MSASEGTKQLDTWKSDFGKNYTDRNPSSATEMDRILGDYYAGVKKSDIFSRYITSDRLSSGRVLEVGCNVGAQLGILNSVNPKLELYGIDPQSYALARARELNPGFHFLPANAFDLPYKDGYFDLVMTNDVLIHISPNDLPAALSEIYRVSKKYIFCHEYFSENLTQVNYKGHEGLLWKMDFASQYLKQFERLAVVEMDYLTYPDPDGGPELMHQTALLEKKL